jgi:putative sigma-54 modulation protein
MSLNMSFRKVKATEALKEHIEKKVAKFNKFVSYPIQIDVHLSIDKAYQCAEITCHAEHRQLVAVAKSKDLYESIDMVAHKIEAQLKKERERKKGHNSAHLAVRPTATRLARDVNADIPHREKKQRNSTNLD